jgi:hypothetical protein
MDEKSLIINCFHCNTKNTVQSQEIPYDPESFHTDVFKCGHCGAVNEFEIPMEMPHYHELEKSYI